MMTTFKELLQQGNHFSTELITNDYETNYSFEWGGEVQMTEEGIKRFQKIMNSTYQITPGAIILQDDTLTEEELEAFTSAAAGYCSVKSYDRWFAEVKQ